jgi:hypothetical protein
MTVCFLDISKAFDKVNHSVLMLKLMQRKLPRVLIQLFYYWYSISSNVVRWGRALSASYALASGVRQGSVISPVLFSIYMDDMLNTLNSNGCSFHGITISAIMYADDLCLISPSVYGLQALLNECCDELIDLDLCINFSKSVALRIGKRHNGSCCNLSASGSTIKWVTEAKYLGIYIRSGQKFACNFDKQKAKFYRAANCIFAKLGNLNNIPVTLHLVHSIALPTLTYALEAIPLTKTQVLSLEHPWSRMVMKVFKTFDQKIVEQCQYLSDLLPMRHIYTLRRMGFLSNIETSDNSLLRHIYEITNNNMNIFVQFANKYNCNNVAKFVENYSAIVKYQFKLETVEIDN